MATEKQRAAARRNIKKAQAAARDKRTIANFAEADAHRAREAGRGGAEEEEQLRLAAGSDPVWSGPGASP